MEEILYKSFVTSCNRNSDDPIDHIKCQLDRIHESVARGCYQTVLAGTMPLAFATQIGRLTRRVYLPCRSSNVERTCDDFNTSSLLVRAHDPRIVSTCFLLSNEINSALENSPSNALYDYAKNILVAGIDEVYSRRLNFSVHNLQRERGSDASWRGDRIARRTRVVPRDNVSQRFATRVSKRRRNFASLMKTGGIGP